MADVLLAHIHTHVNLALVVTHYFRNIAPVTRKSVNAGRNVALMVKMSKTNIALLAPTQHGPWQRYIGGTYAHGFVAWVAHKLMASLQ